MNSGSRPSVVSADSVYEPERQAYQRERVERAKAEATVQTLEAELTELRGESRKALEIHGLGGAGKSGGD